MADKQDGKQGGESSDLVSTSTMFNVMDGAAVMRFTGDDKTYSSTKWAQDIDDNAEIFGWKPAQKLIIARRSLDGTAAMWLRSERNFKTYDELKTALQKEFPEAINSKEMHELMAARKKNKEESYYQYMLTMKELGKRARFPDYVAIQYVIDGIVDYEPNKAILYGVTTYPALKEKLLLYEKMKDNMKPKKTEKLDKAETSGKKQATVNRRRCYKCGDDDHVAISCTKGIKCFRCNEYGHIGQQCMSGVKPTSGSSTSKHLATKQQPAQVGGKAVGSIGVPVKKYPFTGTTDVCKMAASENDTNDEVTLTADIEVKENMQVENKTDCRIPSSSRKPMKSVTVCGKIVNSLIDSGSDVNLMSVDLYDSIGVQKSEDDVMFSGLGLLTVRSMGKITTDIIIDGQCYYGVLFHIIPTSTMPYDLIVGQEFLCGVTMIMKEGSVLFLPKGDDWMGGLSYFAGCVDVFLDHVKNPVLKKEVLQCIENYRPVPTRQAPIELRIVLKDDVPVSQRPRRLSLMEQHIVEQQVDEWLANGVIRVSYSEYSSPLVLVKKKDGTVRVCVDYRLLNRKIVKDEFPLPIIENLIDRLSNTKVYSVLDLKNGFFHLKISEESIRYTSFVTHHGQFEFLRAPFGLSVCPKTFMRFVTIIFRELIAEGVMTIFIDDILISAEDEVQAVTRLKQVLEVASSYGLEINWKKAHLICREIEYLGHIISNGEVRPSPEKTAAVVRYPEPRTIKELHSFIGLASYFRKYIENFAAIAKPLTDILRKGANFMFQEEQRSAFETLKMKLASGPVLKIYDQKLRTELHTDASSIAYSAILMQHHPNSGLHPVHFMSRKTSEAQSNYSSYELEALAIVEGVKKFRHYLYGVHFKIVTDCKAFVMTLKKKDLTPKVARWVLLLDEYDYEVEQRAGTKMRHVDALSRNPPYIAAVDNLYEQIALAQDQDDGLKAIKDILKEKTIYHDYWLQNNLLFKGESKQLVIPRSWEKEILQRVHSNGHFAKRKMKELISRDYYMKNVDKKIDEFIIGCIPCLLATKKEGRQEGFLNSIEKGNVPLDTIHVDHVGPLTETKKQYNYILTVIDSFTKFVWLFPTKTTSAKETLDKLRIHQQTFGNPRRIITDRGTAFTSHEFTGYCTEENIEYVRITTGVPRGNGQVERVHRIIIPILTKLCIENQTLWYRHIGRVQRALNSTYQRSLGFTPFEMMTGTKMRNKDDIEILDMIEQEDRERYNENREELRIQAKQQILKIQDENKKTYNSRRKESSKYELGDLVAIKRTQFGPGLKLKPKYLGPYRIVKAKRNDRYDLEKTDSSAEGPNRTSSSADNMKRWPQSGDPESIGE